MLHSKNELSAWLCGTWLVFHVTAITAETHRPLCSHLLASVNVLQVPVNDYGCSFFLCGGIQWHLCFITHFCVRHHFVRLPLCCPCHRATEEAEYWLEGSAPTDTTNIHLCCCGLTSSNRGHYFWSSPHTEEESWTGFDWKKS